MRRQMVKGGAVAHVEALLKGEGVVLCGEEAFVELDGHLPAARIGLGEGVAGDDVLRLEELHGEVVGAGHRKPKASLSLMGASGRRQFLKWSGL